MKPISNFMAKLARDFSDQPVVVEVILRGQWKNLMGERINTHSLPIGFQDGVLQVGTSDERWMEELSRLSEDIRKRINTFLGKEVVRTIRFTQKS
ncbi:MAG TPA: DUF721 domain-containing protein [Acidobacteriota bacterium]|jgi:predicted nucleic acid-binding Zn ribbon protein